MAIVQDLENVILLFIIIQLYYIYNHSINLHLDLDQIQNIHRVEVFKMTISNCSIQ